MYYCFDLPSNRIRHFPAGTYNEQMTSPLGATELSMAGIVWQVWRMFQHLGLGQWGQDELRFSEWMMEDDKPPTTLPLLENLMAALYVVSARALDMLRRTDYGNIA